MSTLITNNVLDLDGNVLLAKGQAAKYVNSLQDLLAANMESHKVVNVLNYHTGLEGGGGVFYWDASKPKSEHNGGTVIDPVKVFPTDWNSQTQLTTWLTAGSSGTGCWVRQYDGAVNVKWFGAKGDGVSDDTKAIQKAIDCVEPFNRPTEVIIPSDSTYVITVGVRTGISDGVAGIVMKDNVTLIINGTLFAKAGIYGVGTLSALIKSPDAGNIGICIKGNGTVDGNRDNQTPSAQCDNIYLRAIYQVKVEGIKSINANGNGILINKAIAGVNHVDVSVINTIVTDANNIGIQVSHSAANLIISGNQVTTCGDNCIDVYNENGTITPDSGIITISGNTVAGGLVGIFPETSQNCSVVGNSIGSCSTGIQTNRINGAPSNIVISGNSIYNCPTGIVGSGDTKGVLICTNTLSAFSTAGVLLTGTTVSAYTVHGNMFIPSTTTTPIIELSGTTFVWNQIFNNVCEDPSHDITKGVVVSSGSVSHSNTIEPIIYSNQHRSVKTSASGSTSSGGILTIAVPACSGKLLIKSSSGGAWDSVWSGSFVSSGSKVAVSQDSTAFTAPGNNIAQVVGSASTSEINVTWAASGSPGEYSYQIEYL